MKVNKNYEAELSLKDFLFHILYKWRIILLIGLIAAGILGFREYWSFEKYHRNGELTPAEASYEQSVASARASLAQTESDIAAYNTLIQEKSAYRDNSILMKIDPMNIWTAEKKYHLNLDGSPDDHSYATMTALSEAFFRDLPAETLTEAFGTTDRNDINEIACIALNRGLWTISVIGCGNSEEEAIRRKELVDSCLQETMQNLQQTKVFTLDLYSDSVGTRTNLLGRNINGDIVEKDLAYIQNSVSESIRNYENQQQPYFSTLKTHQANAAVEKPAPKTVMQAILGFILGAVVTILILTLFYLFSGRLKTAREMKNRYDLSILGELAHSRAWWKGKGIDWVLERLEFGKKKKTDPEKILDSIASLPDPERNGKTLLLTGTLEEKELAKVCEGLSARLQEKGITVTVRPEFLLNSEAIDASMQADTVILVEEKYKSKVKDMNRMAEMLEIKGANVLGAVLI